MTIHNHSLSCINENDSMESSSDSDAAFMRREVLLVFLCGVGANIGWTAVLSNIVYYSATMGMDSYLLLNAMAFGPMLPVTLAQLAWDDPINARFGTHNAYWCRGMLCFGLTTTLCLLSIRSLPVLSIATFFLGLASAAVQGTMKQLCTLLDDHYEPLYTASVTMGMQAAALFVLAASACTGQNLDAFYRLIAVVSALSTLAYHTLLSQPIVQDVLLEDSEEPEDVCDMEEPLLLEDVCLPQEHVCSYWSVWKDSKSVCVSMAFTVGSSTWAASWFNRVPCHDPSLPRTLFYARLCADMAGRLLTMHGGLCPTTLLWCATLRPLLFLPLYVCYLQGMIPTHDVFAVLGVVWFALTSGYLATTCYRIGPSLLHDRAHRTNRIMKQTNLINLCFSASMFLGLVASFSLRGSVFP